MQQERINPLMLTKAIKWAAISALIGSGLWRSSPNLLVVSQFIITAAAAIVVAQAAIMRRYVWMALFLMAACLFNPVVAVPISSYVSGLAGGFALFLFFFSLELLKPQPRMSITSITDRTPGSESP
jgi:hypothetical protein